MDNQMPPVPPVPPVLPPAEKSKDWLKILLAAIGVLIVLGLFGNIYLLLQKENQKPSTQITPTPTQTAFLPTPTPGLTTNWKTYSNTSLGISIRYQQEMQLTEYSSRDSGPDVIGKFRVAAIKGATSSNSQFQFEILISYFNTPLSITQWYENNKSKLINPEDEVTKTEILLGNKLGIKQIRRNGNLPEFTSNEAFVSHQNKIIEISGSSTKSSSEEKLFDQILSTFQFLD